MKPIDDNIKEIEDKYVFGIEKNGNLHFPSYKELADVYKCSKGTIFNYSKKGQWEEKREIFKNKTLNKINVKKENVQIENISDNISDEVVGFDLKCLNIAKDGVERCSKLLEEFSLEEQKAYAIERISSALEKFQKVGKNAIGEALPESDTININFVDSDERDDDQS